MYMCICICICMCVWLCVCVCVYSMYVCIEHFKSLSTETPDIGQTPATRVRISKNMKNLLVLKKRK